jgi:hypothetical protein
MRAVPRSVAAVTDGADRLSGTAARSIRPTETPRDDPPGTEPKALAWAEATCTSIWAWERCVG